MLTSDTGMILIPSIGGALHRNPSIPYRRSLSIPIFSIGTIFIPIFFWAKQASPPQDINLFLALKC